MLSKMKISTEGAPDQVRIPEEILRHLGVQPGEAIDVDFWSDGTCILHLVRKSSRIESLCGVLADRPRKRKKPLSLKQMRKAIEATLIERQWMPDSTCSGPGAISPMD